MGQNERSDSGTGDSEIMRWGLDFDGVITARVSFFAMFTKLLVVNGHEVHVITGNRGTPEFMENLIVGLGISFTHFFSISDHHHNLGTEMTGYADDSTWIDVALWDRTKGWYCKEKRIDAHLDDSKDYGQYFETPYCLFQV